MKKLLLLIVFIMSILCSVRAGYVIMGIETNDPYYSDLMNYTLTFDASGTPIAAATMRANSAYGTGRKCIVIVDAINQNTIVFPVSLTHLPSADYDIEVRDFHRVGNNYLLCGSRESGGRISAFVAIIDGTFWTMDYIEYPEAEIFYSLWPGDCK